MSMGPAGRRYAMAHYATLGDVATWYDEHGAGPPLVLLHPGMVDARAFGPTIGPLATRRRVYTPERRGHGHTADVDGPLSFDDMADDTAAFVETVIGEPADLVGCSDGAIVALVTAQRRPDLVRRLVVVSGVFHHAGWLPGVIDDPDAEPPEAFVDMYGEVSPDGRDHFPVVADKMARLHLVEPTLTEGDLAAVTVPTLVMAGDDDEIDIAHTAAMFRALPDAELAIVPGTSHGLMVEKPDLVNGLILDFLTTEPVRTLAPRRRAAPDRAAP